MIKFGEILYLCADDSQATLFRPANNEKMNRIILIGNGFDLAHGLKTRYRDFINWYWEEFSKNIYAGRILKEYDASPLVEFKIDTSSTVVTYPDNMTTPVASYLELSERIELHKTERKRWLGSEGGIKLVMKSPLFERINKSIETKKWVDIERDFYDILKETCKVEKPAGIRAPYTNPKNLNRDWDAIRDKLIEYLSTINDNSIKNDVLNTETKKIITELFTLEDISISGQDQFLDNVWREVVDLPGGMCQGEIEEEMNNHPEYSVMNNEQGAHRAFMRDRIEKRKLDKYLEPNRILLLNFNYTETVAKLYIDPDNRIDTDVIHIHGELNNLNNPVILGYGDEIDENYKNIVNLDDNQYLQNIKSIHYLETSNYRNLLAFIDSDPYQVYIMGHSCGNSDRTMLNTLFEHKNCVSIKPYYYKESDNKYNYTDIIQNISRNFKDATLMRDRVVNKTLCTPLPQNKFQ